MESAHGRNGNGFHALLPDRGRGTFTWCTLARVGRVPACPGYAVKSSPSSTTFIRFWAGWQLMDMASTKVISIGALRFSPKSQSYRTMPATFFTRGWDEVCGSLMARSLALSPEPSRRLHRNSILMPGAEWGWVALMPGA